MFEASMTLNWKQQVSKWPSLLERMWVMVTKATSFNKLVNNLNPWTLAKSGYLDDYNGARWWWIMIEDKN
jgi:hypothetical protein